MCIIDSLFTRLTHRGSLPQKQSITGPPLDGDTAVHGPAAFGARIRSCFANQIGIKWEKTGDNGMHFPGADLVSMARVARECRVFSSECGQNIPVLPVGLRKVEMYRFCGNKNEESFELSCLWIILFASKSCALLCQVLRYFDIYQVAK